MIIVIVATLLILFLVGIYLLLMAGPIGWVLLALILVGMIIAAVVVWS